MLDNPSDLKFEIPPYSTQTLVSMVNLNVAQYFCDRFPSFHSDFRADNILNAFSSGMNKLKLKFFFSLIAEVRDVYKKGLSVIFFDEIHSS